jgi:hypothetical protein
MIEYPRYASYVSITEPEHYARQWEHYLTSVNDVVFDQVFPGGRGFGLVDPVGLEPVIVWNLSILGFTVRDFSCPPISLFIRGMSIKRYSQVLTR